MTRRNDTKLRRNKSLEHRLLAYSAAAGALMQGATAMAGGICQGVADGDICYNDIPDQTMAGPTSQQIELDLDGDGSPDFTLTLSGWVLSYDATGGDLSASWRYYLGVTPGNLAAVQRGFGSATRGPDSNQPAALLSGDSVGSSGAFRSAVGTLGYSAGTFDGDHEVSGNFAERFEQRFLGLRFEFGDATHYGWLRVQVNLNFGWPEAGLTVFDYAFDLRPGTTIAAGETGGIIFTDGFETGDLTKWSDQVP